MKQVLFWHVASLASAIKVMSFDKKGKVFY